MRRGGSTGKGLWSAQALREAPELVAEIHRDFINAGAAVIITNTYSTVPSYMEKEGLGDQYLTYAGLAGEIARQVADETPGAVNVAASLPPLSESYRPDLVPPDEESRPVYEALANVLNPYADLFLCETMSSVREAVNAATAARTVAPDKPLWVSWTLNETPGGGLRSGESIAEALEALAPFAPDAYLFNCTTPDAIGAGLRELRALTDRPVGAYPNRFFVPQGWTLDNEISTERSEMTVEEFLTFARAWREGGMDIIGGCCGIGPDFIGALAREARA